MEVTVINDYEADKSTISNAIIARTIEHYKKLNPNCFFTKLAFGTAGHSLLERSTKDITQAKYPIDIRLSSLVDVHNTGFLASAHLVEGYDPDYVNYLFNISDFESYKASLSRKQRSNLKSYLKKANNLDFKLLSYDEFLNHKYGIYHLILNSIKSPFGLLDTRIYTTFLDLCEEDYSNKLIYMIYENDTLLGYNLGYIENSTYYDICFVNKGAHSYSKIIIARLISEMASDPKIDIYNLGYGCSYKKDLMPFKEAKSYKYDYPCNVPEGLSLQYLNPRELLLSYNNEINALYQEDKQIYYSSNASDDWVSKVKEVFPYIVKGNKENTCKELDTSFATFYQNSLLNKTNVPYYSGMFVYGGYRYWVQGEITARFNNLRYDSCAYSLSQFIKTLEFAKDFTGANLIESGWFYNKPTEIPDNALYTRVNHCLKWYPNKEDLIKSFSSKRRKDINSLLEQPGLIIDHSSSFKESELEKFAKPCFDKFKEIHPIMSIIKDYTQEKDKFILIFSKYTECDAYLTFIKRGDYWVYSSFYQTNLKCEPLAKLAVLKSAEFIYEKTRDSLFDLTSVVEFIDRDTYSLYKKTISNHTNILYAFTVATSSANLLPPYYNLDQQEWIL